MEIFMKVPQHTIKPVVVKTVASEELQQEVEEQIAAATETEEETPDMSELLDTQASTDDEEVSD